MKFSLRFLILIVPCLLVASYFVIWQVLVYFGNKQLDRSLPYWEGTQFEIEELSKFISEKKITDDQLSVANLNIWFGEEISSTEPAATLLKEFDHYSFKTDSWGQTYVAVGLDDNNHPTQDPLKARAIGIYSNGKDGVSNSHGCDIDDLASWRMEVFLAYHEKQQDNYYWWSRKIGALIILLTGVFALLLLWFVGVVGYRMLFQKA